MTKEIHKKISDDTAKKAEKLIRDAFSVKEEQKERIKSFLNKKGRKKFIEDSTVSYRAYYNKEYMEHLIYIKQVREQQKNDYALDSEAWKTGFELRLSALVPERLTKFINNYLTPTFPVDKKELRWFLKKFPVFQIPRKL